MSATLATAYAYAYAALALPGSTRNRLLVAALRHCDPILAAYLMSQLAP